MAENNFVLELIYDQVTVSQFVHFHITIDGNYNNNYLQITFLNPRYKVLHIWQQLKK